VKFLARPTTESAGNGTLCGPLLNAVQRLIPGTIGYVVNYLTDFSSSSPDKGVADVLRHFKTQAKAYPQQKHVLSGYSQDAVVMHRAALKLYKLIFKERIIATTTFKDRGQ
jgi:hypothetical protein